MLQDCLLLFKRGWSLLIRRLSINVTLKSLLLVARIENSSKSGVWLQNKRCSLMAESSSPLILHQWLQKFQNFHTFHTFSHITEEGKKKTRQMTFFIYFLSSGCDIHLWIWKLSTFIFMGPTLVHPFWSAKYLNFRGDSCEIRILPC